MPTIKTIAADGSWDFETLQQWEDWRRLQPDPAQWAQVMNKGNVGPVVMTGGPTTSGTAYPRIFADVQHDGTDGFGSYIESSTQACIESSVANLHIEGLRIRHGNQSGIITHVGKVYIAGNLIIGVDAGDYKAGIVIRSDVAAVGSFVEIQNNFIVYGLAGDPGAAGVSQAAIWFDAQGFNISHVRLENNTIVGTTGMKAALGASRTAAETISFDAIDWNIFCTNLTQQDASGLISSGTGSFNLYSDVAQGLDGVGPYDAVDVVVDPAADWKLLEDSPAINQAGSGLGADAFGTARPIGDNWDLGAYEAPQAASGGLRSDYFNIGPIIAPDLSTYTPDYSRIEGPIVHENQIPEGGFTDQPPGINRDSFAARFRGFFRPLYSETYTLQTNTVDDDSRLEVDGVEVFDWSSGNSGTIALNAGQLYRIIVDYKNDTGGGLIHLKWSSSSQTEEAIPADRLYPDDPFTRTYSVRMRGAAQVVPNFTVRLRGAASIMNSYSARARGRCSVGYTAFAARVRGAAKVFNTFTCRGRGIARVGYSSFSLRARGTCDVQNTFTCRARGTSSVYQSFSAQLRGESRVANSALARYEIYHGLDAPPDLTGAPEATFTSLPYTTGTLATDTVHHFVIRQRNAWGLISQNVDEFTIDVAGDGTENPTPPSDPVEVKITAGPSGVAVVTAQYLYRADGDNAADKWLIYLAVNATPNVGVTTPVVVSIAKSDGVAKLRYTTAAQVEGAVVHVIVRVRRTGTPNVDSVDATVHSATATLLGPAAVNSRAIFIGTEHEQTQ